VDWDQEALLRAVARAIDANDGEPVSPEMVNARPLAMFVRAAGGTPSTFTYWPMPQQALHRGT
jgi:hypothetical protein